MSKEKRTITNESGKSIMMMIDSEDILMVLPPSDLEVWYITPGQWRRLVRESDNTAWSTERGSTIHWICFPYAAGCKYPGRN